MRDPERSLNPEDYEPRRRSYRNEDDAYEERVQRQIDSEDDDVES